MKKKRGNKNRNNKMENQTNQGVMNKVRKKVSSKSAKS